MNRREFLHRSALGLAGVTLGVGLVNFFGLIGVAWGLLIASIAGVVIQGTVFFRLIALQKNKI